MQSQDERGLGLKSDIGGGIIIVVSFLLIVQSLYVLVLLCASYNRQPLVFGLPERDQSHNV